MATNAHENSLAYRILNEISMDIEIKPHPFANIGDGQRDAAPVIQQALDRQGEINIPSGNYLLGDTLRVHSNTSIVASPGSTFRLADGVGKHSRNFIENITLSADTIRPNQDGIHVGGFSERGVIRAIRAVGAGVPNDDMVALNADDDVERQLNLGMRRGPIRNLLVENIEAEDAYTFIRLLSVSQPIEDISVKGLRGGCRIHGINLNNWRFPKGVGCIRRVRFEDIDLAKTEVSDGALAIVKISLAINDLVIRQLHRQETTLPRVKTLVIDGKQDLAMILDGRSQGIDSAAGFVLANGNIAELRLHAHPSLKEMECGTSSGWCSTRPSGPVRRWE